MKPTLRLWAAGGEAAGRVISEGVLCVVLLKLHQVRLSQSSAGTCASLSPWVG
jgi:hypothetical protein